MKEMIDLVSISAWFHGQDLAKFLVLMLVVVAFGIMVGVREDRRN